MIEEELLKFEVRPSKFHLELRFRALRALSHRPKAKAKAKKIKEQAKKIK